MKSSLVFASLMLSLSSFAQADKTDALRDAVEAVEQENEAVCTQTARSFSLCIGDPKKCRFTVEYHCASRLGNLLLKVKMNGTEVKDVKIKRY